jgi:hypothetical protein
LDFQLRLNQAQTYFCYFYFCHSVFGCLLVRNPSKAADTNGFHGFYQRMSRIAFKEAYRWLTPPIKLNTRFHQRIQNSGSAW